MNRLLTALLCFVAGAFALSQPVAAQDFPLEEPPFAATKQAGQANSFPALEAGMSAYAKVNQSIDLVRIRSAFSLVEGVGANYIYGIVLVENFAANFAIRVYADSDGWLVAYLKNNEPAAKAMQWRPATAVSPQIATIPRNTLSDALEKARDAAGIGFLEQIKYYNFRYPDADRLTLFVKTITRAGTVNTLTSRNTIKQVQIPSTHTLYEASYHHYGYTHDIFYAADPDRFSLKVDGTSINAMTRQGGIHWRTVLSSYQGAIVAGKLHTIEIEYVFSHNNYGSTGVATALVYKTGE